VAESSQPGENGPCPVGCCADIVAGKWTLLIIRDLCDGPRYFRDLELSLAGISPRTLCERLKFLTQQGLVSRTYIKALPPRTQYDLTEAGRALVPLIGAMRQVGTIMLEARAALEASDQPHETVA
jgi:DNA-binding HxlR family transcriptional regulator